MEKKTLIKFTGILILSLVIFSGWSWGAQAAMVGQQMPFYVDRSYDLFGRTALVATLQEISEQAYFYTEDEWFNALSSVNSAKAIIHNLAIEFDQKIYPRLTKVYGSLWEPGIDNDPKISILISRMQEGAGGYFNSADEYLRIYAPLSNEREMVYLNALYFDSPRAKSYLAHEFQHLISFYQKDKLYGVSDEIWLNEARSEYSPTLCGYDEFLLGSNLEKRILDFYKNPSDSLTEWSNGPNDYGTINLFMQYVASHFGEQVLTKMVQNPQVGIASIDEALKLLGFEESFSSVFANWTIANYLNDCKTEGQRYCYLNAALNEKIKVLPTITQDFPSINNFSIDRTDFTKDWAGHWYKFTVSNGSSNLKIQFKGGENTNFKVAYIIERTNGTPEVNFIKLDLARQGIAFVQNFSSEIESLVLIPISQTKNSGFSALEPFYQFSYQMSITQEGVVPTAPSSSTFIAPNYPDGSLIRARGGYKVYIIKDGFKRWIQSAEVFRFYPHLSWDRIIEVTPQERDWYRDAWLVRADGDFRVYEINGDGTKHWLNMTAQQFWTSGRQWAMVYVINKQERDWYRNGVDVLYK